MDNIYVLTGLFFVIAFLYSTVGFGGGSSYIAILAIFNFQQHEMKSTSLLCNIVVVAASFLLFYKHKLVEFKKFLPLALYSIPLAFLGGYMAVSDTIYFIVLSVALFVSAILLFSQTFQSTVGILIVEGKAQNTLINSIIGGSIGFLSGLVGIGGGIFLSPILHFRKWATPKVIAAMASFFILVNSISGLIGQAVKSSFVFNYGLILPLLLSVFVGGQLGVRLSVKIFSEITVKRLTALLVFYVSLNILFTKVL